MCVFLVLLEERGQIYGRCGKNGWTTLSLLKWLRTKAM